MKISARHIAIVLTTVLVLTSCNSNDAVTGSPSVHAIPFLTGTSHTYRSTVQQDSSGKVIYADSISFSVKVLSNNETLNGLTGLTLLGSYPIGSTSVVQKVWYKIGTDTLTEIANQFFSSGNGQYGLSGFPKQQKNVETATLFTVPRTVQRWLNIRTVSDSITLRSKPRIVYTFPLNVGKQWNSFQTPFFLTREVVGSEMVSVGAGKFFCMKIRSTIDSSIQYYDYVSSEGLILRTLNAYLPVTTESNPDGNGLSVNIAERLELISTN